jgi:hypothetical protein
MCGSNKQQDETYQEQAKMTKTLSDAYASAYSNNQNILGALTKVFTPILNAGPMQQGMSPEALASQNTMASENIAKSYAQAQKATGDILGAQGGGNAFLPSGTNAALMARQANASASDLAAAKNAITQQNYQMGYQNWQNAAGALNNIASQYNPLGYSGQQISGSTAQGNTAYQMAQAANSPWNAAIGALGAVGGAALGNMGSLSGMFGGASKMLSGSNPLISGFKSLQNMPAPFMPSNLGMSGGVPTFGAGA